MGLSMPAWKSLALDTLAAATHAPALLARPWGLLTRARRLAGLRRRLRFPVPASTQFDGEVEVAGSGEVRLGEYCRLGPGVLLETRQQGRIALGSHVRVNQGCVFVAYRQVAIGDDCLIGEYVSIRDANHGLRAGRPMRLQEHDCAPIRIGCDVWIGRGACILPGVEIGDGAVIGANSVVTRSVPAGMVAAGVPARVLRPRPAEAVAAPLLP